MMKRYPQDREYIIKWDLIVLYKDLHYVEVQIAMFYYDAQKLRIEEIRLIKVWQKHHIIEKDP